MKKFLSLILISLTLICFVFKTEAQTRTSTVPNIKQGQFIDFGGVYPTASDSLQVTDTVAYIIPITHDNELGNLYHTWFWNKIGSGTATITVNYLQGNDPNTFFPVKAGVAQTNYSKTFVLSSSGWNEISFQRDTAGFYGRYLKVQMFTSNTANVGGKVVNRLKTSFK